MLSLLTTGLRRMSQPAKQSPSSCKPSASCKSSTDPSAGMATQDNPKSALILIAKGTEEMECITAVDVLRRGGITVHLAGLCGNKPVKCRSDSVISPDIGLADAKGPYDAIVLPGGLDGSKAFCQSEELGELLRAQEKCGRIVAAICAAPTALKAHKIGLKKRVTSYPSMKSEMVKDGCYTYVDDQKVVVDGNVITSQGPATAINFAIVLVEQICGREKAQEVSKGLLFDYCSLY
ncbi:protein dj-1beta-like [Ctenocephalides felis]|uniref:protein dj-1beta-like n=1 Tax=Ctenocephalides felis TaxID=7515 RepID=UPI000E6E1E16|nr:protein dj-1beta-like [Ctenocephalides felis]